MGRPIPIWMNEEEEEMIKKMAKKQHRSISNFVKTKCGVFKPKKK